MENRAAGSGPEQDDRRKIKCVVWDLDDTLWSGVLLEDPQVSLREQIPDIVRTLDARGVLQSIASRNDYEHAMSKLREVGLDEYFLCPQINWNSKVHSLRTIAQAINIGLDSLALIDDQPFELEEVAFTLPEVLCIDAREVDGLLDRPEMNPTFITDDSQMRRRLYLLDAERQRAEEEFKGSQDEFLSTLGMSFTIAPAQEVDLQRAAELTVRTHQLNTTGYTYSYDELNHFRQSDNHTLLIASLEDRFGSYGKIGLALVEREPRRWTIKLLLMSCRVMSRGVGSVMLGYIMRLAKKEGVVLRAEFVSNDRNRMMYVTYKFAGFREFEIFDDRTVLENGLERIQPFPEYVNLVFTHHA